MRRRPSRYGDDDLDNDLDDVLCSGNEQTESSSTSFASGIRTANVPANTDDPASVGEVTANPRIHNIWPICKVEVQETTNSWLMSYRDSSNMFTHE